MNYKELKNQENAMPTLTQVVDEMRTWNTVHVPYDRATKLPLFRFDVIEEGKGGALVPHSNITTQPAVYLKPHAMNNLLSRLDIGQRLYQRLPPKLDTLMVNWLIQNEQEKNILLRIQDENQVRALLSGRYEPFDNLELLEALLPFCGDGKVKVAYDNEEVFHLSIIFPGTEKELRKGDVVQTGIHVSNSEVGMRSVTVAGFVWRCKCANGLVGSGDDGGFYRFRHMGDTDRLVGAIKASIESTYMESTGITEMFKRSIEMAIENPMKKLQSIVEGNNMTKEDYNIMLNHYLEEPEPNLFGVVNAITATARDLSGEDSYQLQRIGAKVLTEAA